MSPGVRLTAPHSLASKLPGTARDQAPAPASRLRTEAAGEALDAEARLARAERLGHRYGPLDPPPHPAPPQPGPSPAAPTVPTAPNAGTPVQLGKKKRNQQAHQASGPGAGHHDILQNRRLPPARRERLAEQAAEERAARAARLQAEREERAERERKRQEEKKNR